MAGYIGSKSSVTQVDGYTEAEADAEFVNDPNGTITVDGDNVGIGTSSPAALLDLKHNSASTHLRLTENTSGNWSALGVDTSDNLRIYANSDERMRIDASGNVGIGTSSPVADFVVSNGGAAGIELQPEISTDTNRITNYDRAASAYMNFKLDALTHQFICGGTEAMRIDSSGRVLTDTTNTSAIAQSGNAMTYDNGRLEVQKYRSPALRVGNYTDGFGTYTSNAVEFYSGGSLVGSIGIVGGAKEVSISANHINGSGLYLSSGNNILPMKDGGLSDNTQDFGKPSIRWDDIYATNGSIQTSDFNEKQDIASLTATEMLVGKRISALFKTFRWKDSVAEKGDNARTHTGVIAQDVQAAFTAEGLDAGDYALFISSTWWEHDVDVPAVEAVAEVTDEDGNVTTEAVEAKDAYTRTDTYDTEDEAPEGATSKTRLGIRYPELLSFVAAYNEQRFASIEARLTALEA